MQCRFGVSLFGATIAAAASGSGSGSVDNVTYACCSFFSGFTYVLRTFCRQISFSYYSYLLFYVSFCLSLPAHE
ncbi:uncharacterized protein BDV14DRAFT_53736 [Aspergillus stella-maris]|uniref:uncharacterized protein n=1 Tax=Aspergillus stella-maris TaxID=1810926 RepID=UPI003CCD4293